MPQSGSGSSHECPRSTAPRRFTADVPPHAQVQSERAEIYSSQGELEDEVPQRLYDREPVSQPQLQRPRYSVLRWISWLIIVAACFVLIVMIAAITKPFSDGSRAQWATESEAPQASNYLVVSRRTMGRRRTVLPELRQRLERSSRVACRRN